MGARTKGETRVELHHHGAGLGHRLVVGNYPEVSGRSAWRESPSATLVPTPVFDRGGGRFGPREMPSAAARAATAWASSMSPAKRACSRVAGQSRNSPGAGSSTGSSRMSLKVTLVAPHSKQAFSATSTSRSRSSKLSSRNAGGAKTAPRANAVPAAFRDSGCRFHPSGRPGD